MKELEQAILDLIRDIYKVKYTGKIKVTEVKDLFNPTPVGYKLSLGLNKDERPISIACDGSKEDFLKCICKELHARHFDIVDYFTAIQLYPYEESKQRVCN